MHSCPTRFASTPSVAEGGPTTPRHGIARRSTTKGECAAVGRARVLPSTQTTRVGTSPRPSRTAAAPPPRHSIGRCCSAVASTVAGSGCDRSSRSLSLDRASAEPGPCPGHRRGVPDEVSPSRTTRPPAVADGAAEQGDAARARRTAAAVARGGTRARRRPEPAPALRATGSERGAARVGPPGCGPRCRPRSPEGPRRGRMRTVPSPGRVTGGPGPTVRRTRSVVAPTTTVERASTVVTPCTRAPSTNTPLVEPQSSTLTPLGPTPTKRWHRLRDSSATTSPSSTARPRCSPGGTSGRLRPASGPPTTTRSRRPAAPAVGGAGAPPGWVATEVTATEAPSSSGGIPTRESSATARPRDVSAGTGSPRWVDSAARSSATVDRPDHSTTTSTGWGRRRGRCTVSVISMSATVGKATDGGAELSTAPVTSMDGWEPPADRVRHPRTRPSAGDRAQRHWWAGHEHDLPEGLDWLSPGERSRVDAFRFTKRRTEYLLRRWVGKRAVAAHLGLDTDPAVTRTDRGAQPGERRPLPRGRRRRWPRGRSRCPTGRGVRSPSSPPADEGEHARWASTSRSSSRAATGFVTDFLTPGEQAWVDARGRRRWRWAATPR